MESNSNQIVSCRPSKLTCRWLKEISESINNLCPTQPKIKYCNNLEQQWTEYQQSLTTTLPRCSNKPTVTNILNYNTDYNTYR